MPKNKTASGVAGLDTLIKGYSIGDNVVREVEAGTAYNVFILNFIARSFKDHQKLISVNFNHSPQTVLNDLRALLWTSTLRLRYNWLCHAYCLLDSNDHLMRETPNANLSRYHPNLHVKRLQIISKFNILIIEILPCELAFNSTRFLLCFTF